MVDFKTNQMQFFLFSRIQYLLLVFWVFFGSSRMGIKSWSFMVATMDVYRRNSDIIGFKFRTEF